MEVLKHNKRSEEAEKLIATETLMHNNIMEEENVSQTNVTKDQFEEIV